MFGQNLKKLRTSKNLSQSKLSKILGISSSTIGMYEQGRRFPDQTILVKIVWSGNLLPCSYIPIVRTR